MKAKKPVGILNFKDVHHVIDGRIGQKKDDVSSDVVAPFIGEKVAGSDVGHMVEVENDTYMIKTGVTLSLLGQALKKSAQGEEKKERLRCKFIVGNFTRVTGEKPGDLVEALLTALNAFKKTEDGMAMLEKLKSNDVSNLNAEEIYVVYQYIVSNYPSLKDVVALPAFADVVGGAYGQFFNNAFQCSQVPPKFLDSHKLLIEKNDAPAIYMASRFIEEAVPFDRFLLEPFLENSRDDFDSDEAWLAACKKTLSDKITSLHGLCSAIFIRHIMGEGGDLGPDNMLIVNDGEQQYLVNIDVTGFRYSRQKPFKDAYGWEGTLKTNGKEALLERLFHGTVFRDRFLGDVENISKELKPEVMKTIVDVLQEKVGNVVEEEVGSVKRWLASQNVNGVKQSLESSMKAVYDALNPALKPSAVRYAKLLEYNKRFVMTPVEMMKALQLEVEDVLVCK